MTTNLAMQPNGMTHGAQWCATVTLPCCRCGERTQWRTADHAECTTCHAKDGAMSALPRVIYATATPCVIVGRDAFSGHVYAWNVSDPDHPVVVGTFGTVRAARAYYDTIYVSEA